MADSISRRAVSAGLLLLPSSLACGADLPFAALEEKGARVGVAALDTGTGKRLAWRADERFVMCSTFKLSLAAATLLRAEQSREDMSRLVHYRKEQLLGVSPATTRNLARGMTVAELCEAAVIYSDNCAANLLLARAGGPAGVTAFWRHLGDKVSRLDRTELALNTPDGDKDTTTPNAMLGNLKAMLLGEALSPASCKQLLAWMHANTTGGEMLKAGLPPDWTIGDKTGRNPQFGFTNDLAIVTPPGRKPILVTVFTARATPEVVAAAGKLIAGWAA